MGGDELLLGMSREAENCGSGTSHHERPQRGRGKEARGSKQNLTASGCRDPHSWAQEKGRATGRTLEWAPSPRRLSFN